jgi:hypothetical protein
MNTKMFAQAALAAFVFVFAFEFVVHGVLLKGMYVETAHLWRSESDSKMQFILMGQIVFSGVTAFLFTKVCDTDFFKNNGPEATEASERLPKLEASLETSFSRWGELSEIIESLEAG